MRRPPFCVATSMPPGPATLTLRSAEPDQLTSAAENCGPLGAATVTVPAVAVVEPPLPSVAVAAGGSPARRRARGGSRARGGAAGAEGLDRFRERDDRARDEDDLRDVALVEAARNGVLPGARQADRQPFLRPDQAGALLFA